MDKFIAERLQVARQAALQAGDVLMRHLGRTSLFEEKGSSVDLVTAADRESEALVYEALTRAFPSDPICREEADGRDGARARRAEIEAADFAWCVDPLDGTTNFVHAVPVFAVSIGLLAKGRPVLGVVHGPAIRETFIGGAGVPATRNFAPIAVSRVSTLSGALIATGFPYDRRARIDALLAALRGVLMSCQGVRRAGAAALDLCNVACGRFDGYYEVGLSPWDSAAGQAIVEAAGGRVTAFDGSPHDLFAARTVASNGLIHDELAKILQTELS